MPGSVLVLVSVISMIESVRAPLAVTLSAAADKVLARAMLMTLPV